MQLNIHNLALKRIGFINNDIPNALHYFDDNWHRYLAEGTSTFDFSVNKNNPAYSMLTLQSYISFTYDGDDYLFNIVNIEQEHASMQVQCVNLNIELINDEVGAYGNTKRHSIVWYLKNAARITDDVLEIGNNPFSLIDEDTANPILSFDSTETKLARIISICNSFNAEFQFKTQLKNDGTLQSITLDLYKAGGVGQKRKDVTLFYGKNVVGISSTANRTSTFFNATTVTDSNKKYKWLAVEGKVYNSEGQLEFYKDAGSNVAYAPLSRDMFPSQLKSSSSDRYTTKNLETTASSDKSLWDYAVSQFKLYAYPQMTYDVVVAANAVTNALGNDRKLDIGDTVTIQDTTFDKAEGGLILSARVSEQEISFTNPSNNKLKFSNFVRLKSQISSDLYGQMKQLVDQNTPYRLEPMTSNGTQFKNGVGSTTITARVYKGSEVSETVADSYEWFKDDVSVANAQTITVDAAGINNKAVYRFQATVAGKMVGTSEITITNVNDGQAGAPGTPGSPGAPGTDGRSVVGIEQKYRLTQTANAPTQSWEDSAWLISQPTMTATNKYLWSITRTTFNKAPLTQDAVEQKAVYGDSGKDGSNGSNGDPGKIVSDKEPTAKFKGLTWKYSGVADMTLGNGTIILSGTEYYWSGADWVLNEINAHNINGDNLSVTNGTFKDGKIRSVWGSGGVNGSTTIEDNHLEIYSTNSVANTENALELDDEQGYVQVYTDHNTGKTTTVQLSTQGLFISGIAGLTVRLTPQGLSQSSKTTSVTIGAGLTLSLERRGEMVIANLSGTINGSLTSGQKFTVGTIPYGYTPNRTVYIPAYMTSSFNTSHIDAGTDGSCTWWGPSTSSGYPRGSQMWFTNDSLPN